MAGVVIVKAYVITGAPLGPTAQFDYDRSSWQPSEAAEPLVFVRPARCGNVPRQFQPDGSTGRRSCSSDRPSTTISCRSRSAQRWREMRSQGRSRVLCNQTTGTVLLIALSMRSNPDMDPLFWTRFVRPGGSNSAKHREIRDHLGKRGVGAERTGLLPCRDGFWPSDTREPAPPGTGDQPAGGHVCLWSPVASGYARPEP